MKIAHVALWTTQLDAHLQFWQSYFSARANEKYISKNNPGFESYFLSLEQGATLEVMTKPGLSKVRPDNATTGWGHIAISLGSNRQVDALAQRAQEQGILIAAPRYTGDGYYEAIIADPDGNYIEIVA